MLRSDRFEYIAAGVRYKLPINPGFVIPYSVFRIKQRQCIKSADCTTIDVRQSFSISGEAQIAKASTCMRGTPDQKYSDDSD